jgi:hypothetical protein
VIDRKKFGNLEYFAQTVSHPSVSIAAVDLPYKRANLHLAGDKLTFTELSATIILDEDLNAYTEMYNWVERLVEENNKSRYNTQETEFSTAVDITLHVLSSHNNTTKKIRYVDCVPTDIGAIDFTATTTDIQYLTFPVTFRFSYFEVL